MKEVYEWFKDFSSLGGYTQYVASKNSASKCFWMVLTLFGLVITLYSIERTFVGFFDYNVTTSVGISDNGTLLFPTVTICNTNRVHCGQLLNTINNCQEVRI